MPFVNTKEMLLKANAQGYAVGAFNAENMETLQAIVSAAQELKQPAIIQTTPGSVNYAGLELFVAMTKSLADKSKTDIALHIDHGESFKSCQDGMEAGYLSVMIDGSKLPLEKNIALTKKVADLAHKTEITVEGELGTLKGKEDNLESSECLYTDKDEAVIFVQKTQVDSLAIAIGTAHGVYAQTPILKVELISEIHKLLPHLPLVLHGASGLSDECIKECIKRGISKINFATELRQAFTKAVWDYLRKNPTAVDPKKYLGAAREAVKQAVISKLKIICNGNISGEI